MPPKLKGNKEGYTNLSIKAKRYDKIHRVWSTLYDPKDMSLTQWATLVMETALTREKFLKEFYPHLNLVRSDANQIIIDDSKRNVVAKVTSAKGTLECSVEDNKQEYILYASMSLLYSP